MARIFISHSYLDEAIAYKLVNFLLAALSIKEEEIFCSSNPDQGLDYRFIGVPDQLKEKLKNSEALIVLITADSLHSAWIPFEVGTFWTTDKPVIPILGPGLIHDDLPGPLRSLLSISIEAKDWSDKVNNAINQLVEQLKIQQKVTKRRNDTLEEFSDALRAWQSQRPAPDVSQQKQIEELTKKLEDKERNYQNQKQKLEQSLQSLQSQIEQLEQKLEQARSQNETDQNEIMRLRELIERSQTASQAQSFTEDLGKGIKLEMIAIPGGKFMMGSPEGEGRDNEKPQHKVTVQPFFMGKYPITQAQYQQVMSKNPSKFEGDEQRPVEQVSWNEAVEFCKRLSKQTGKEYRLPSEAEWEYACRAGTTTAYYFGKSITEEQANYRGSGTTAVGKYPPNVFGLYDMHGNVWEWCEDDWHEDYENAPTDGSAWVSGTSSKKVIRGGSWVFNPVYSRSAYRNPYTRDYRLDDRGLRVVCVAPRTT